MNKYRIGIVGLVLTGFMSCTSLSEGEEGAVGVEQNRRIRLRGNAEADLRDRMDEQSSDINRKRNIEEGRNGSATKPPEARPEQLPNSPVDTTKHTPRPVQRKKGGN